MPVHGATSIGYAARVVSLLRVLLRLAVMALLGIHRTAVGDPLLQPSQAMLVGLVAVMAVLLTLTVVQVRTRLQLFVHLVFDLLWIAKVLFFIQGAWLARSYPCCIQWC